jgi:hypothetical protein
VVTKDEAIHKALKVLNCLNNDRVYETAWVKGAINVCKEALEQPTQEPVMVNVKTHDDTVYKVEVTTKQWQGLTSEDINKITDELNISLILSCDIIDFVMAIEAKLKDKNT